MESLDHLKNIPDWPKNRLVWAPMYDLKRHEKTFPFMKYFTKPQVEGTAGLQLASQLGQAADHLLDQCWGNRDP